MRHKLFPCFILNYPSNSPVQILNLQKKLILAKVQEHLIGNIYNSKHKRLKFFCRIFMPAFWYNNHQIYLIKCNKGISLWDSHWRQANPCGVHPTQNCLSFHDYCRNWEIEDVFLILHTYSVNDSLSLITVNWKPIAFNSIHSHCF